MHQQVSLLSLRAMTALAARSARRVQPLARVLRGDYRTKIERAIAAAESAARGEDSDLVGVLGSLAEQTSDPGGAARAASRAAYTASWIKVAKTRANDPGTVARAATLAVLDAVAAIDAAEDAAAWIDNAGEADVILAAERDAVVLLGLGDPGTLGPLIDLSDAGPLGPLWPDGEPEWFRRAAGGGFSVEG